jgi:hypothetical protein
MTRSLGGFPDRPLKEKHQQGPHLAGFDQFPALLAKQVKEILQLFSRMAWDRRRPVLLGKFPSNEFGAEHSA